MYVAILETEAKPLTHAIEVRVRKIQDQHKRETGMRLDADSALRELDRRDAAGEPIDGDHEFEVAALVPLKLFLVRRGYSPLSIDTVLADANRHGSLWCSTAIDDEDRDEAEALLPGVSAWQWGPEYGDVTGDDRFAGSKGYAGLAVRGKRAGDGVFRD